MCRSPTLPEEYIPEIKERLKPLGIKWEDFKLTNNSCGPHPPPVNPLERVRPARLHCTAVHGAMSCNNLRL